MELQEVCDSLVHETEGVQACVVLDLETSLTLSQSRRAGIGGATIRQASRAAGDIFRGRLLRQLARTLPTEPPLEDFVREAQMTTTVAHLFMSNLPGWNNGLLVCVTDKTVSIGLGWMAVHQAIHHIAEIPPEAAYRAAQAREQQPDPTVGSTSPGDPESVGRTEAEQHAETGQTAKPMRTAPRHREPPQQRVRREPEEAPAPPPTPPAVTVPARSAEQTYYRGVPVQRAQTEKEPLAGKTPEDNPGPETGTDEKGKGKAQESKPGVGKLSARAFFAPRKSPKS